MMELAHRIETEPRNVDPRLLSAFVKLWSDEWKSLAIVPVDGDIEPLFRELTKIASLRAFSNARVIDARRRTADALPELMEAVRNNARTRNIFVVDAPETNAVGQAVAQEADAAALVVKLGETEVERAKAVIALLGRDRFKGTLLLEGDVK
ncbi:MAG: hypothetical protein ACJ790_08390 [Myxococcaceae bacterium]